jgi:hypothetical protein
VVVVVRLPCVLSSIPVEGHQGGPSCCVPSIVGDLTGCFAEDLQLLVLPILEAAADDLLDEEGRKRLARCAALA